MASVMANHINYAVQTSPLLEAKTGLEIKKYNSVSDKICPSIAFSSPEIYKHSLNMK